MDGLKIRDTAQRGNAATKGRSQVNRRDAIDAEKANRESPSAFIASLRFPARRENSRSSRRFGQILIDWNSALRRKAGPLCDFRMNRMTPRPPEKAAA